jgi:hypothetical protein
MKSQKSKKILKVIGIIVGVVALVALVIALSLKQLPVRVLTSYTFDTLWEEGTTMHECAECHDTKEEFHTCSTCHDEHGSVELPELYFYTMLEVTGDVDKVIYIPTNHFFSYSELPNTFLTVEQFMEKWEISGYQSFTMYTRDGEFVSVDKDNVTPNAMFLPYEDGIRFASDDLHESTWVKGLARIIIVGEDTPLVIDGQATSIGRLLLGKTTSITVEEAKVMFRSEEDGETRQAYTSSRVEGAALSDLLDMAQYTDIKFTLQDGTVSSLPVDEVKNAILTKQSTSVVLIIPEMGRNNWLFNVVSIEGE